MELEQYSRRANIKIFGVPEVKPDAGPENPNELVIDICQTHLELNISNSDILLRRRRKLKGKPISIADDLCLGI